MDQSVKKERHFSHTCFRQKKNAWLTIGDGIKTLELWIVNSTMLTPCLMKGFLN